jgi:hypothetical protein
MTLQEQTILYAESLNTNLALIPLLVLCLYLLQTINLHHNYILLINTKSGVQVHFPLPSSVSHAINGYRGLFQQRRVGFGRAIMVMSSWGTLLLH